MKELKPLNWNNNARVGFDGINREVKAIDDVWVRGVERIYISYTVMRYDYDPKEMKEFPKPEYRAIVNPTNAPGICERCFDFEDGKEICEKWRNKFWNDLLKEMKEKIFKEE